MVSGKCNAITRKLDEVQHFIFGMEKPGVLWKIMGISRTLISNECCQTSYKESNDEREQKKYNSITQNCMIIILNTVILW